LKGSGIGNSKSKLPATSSAEAFSLKGSSLEKNGGGNRVTTASQRKPAVSTIKGGQTSGSWPGQVVRVQAGQLAVNPVPQGSADYKANTFVDFNSGSTNNQDYERDYEFGLGDGKGFDEGFPNADPSHFFDNKGLTGSNSKANSAKKTSGVKYRNFKQEQQQQARAKYPKNTNRRTDVLQTGGRTQLTNKNDDMVAAKGSSQGEEDSFEIFTESSSNARMSQIQEFVSEKSLALANLTTESTSNNWVPIISQSI
jgi:hypothetical protein